MKIKAPTEIFRPVDRVESKEEKGGFSEFMGDDERHRRRRQKSEPIEVTDEKVSEAIEAFGRDSQAKANGIQATRIGNGPGLKVVLKDGSGTIVRQLTGEEFLRLRAEVANEDSSRGKILDQKL